MKIEIWSDFFCPFCFIGTRRLENALDNFSHRDKVTIKFKSFQLDPHAPLYDGKTYYEDLAEKFGSIERAKQICTHIEKLGEEVGLSFNFETVKPTNTLLAHRLIKFAEEYNKGIDLYYRLFQSLFADGENISDNHVLLQVANDVGLNEKEVFHFLNDKTTYVKEVKKDLSLARKLNIAGVPYFVFDQRYTIAGAQETKVFEEALQHVLLGHTS